MKELIELLRTTAPKAERFQSNALWPAEIRGVSKYGDNISTDTHDTEEQAKAVCDALEREGFGGERNVFPLKTWVSPVQDPPVLQAADALEQQAKQIEELTALCDRLKQEAQIHAQESRTANATIAEIYQCVTGSTGEPGNWNGAKPVRDKIEELAAALAGKDEALRYLAGHVDPHVKFIAEGALALQPHASLVAKIKADAREEFAAAFDEMWRDDQATRFLRGDYADRIERGEVK